MPQEFAFIIDELLHAQKDEDNNRALYHSKILDSIMDTKSADDFIVALCTLTKRLTVDRLHILGDIFDRGEHADLIMDLLMGYENELDIQWGNHDILWMGAAAGNPASIFVCINNNVKYGNYEVLENGYGISMRNLAKPGAFHPAEPQVDQHPAERRFYPAGSVLHVGYMGR